MSHPDTAPDRLWTPVELPNVPAPAGAYSPGVRTANISNLLFVSGQTPRDQATGEILEGDVEAQTRLTLANMERILIAGGATFANVVSMTVYLADENDWGTFDRVYRTIMSPPYPTRAVVGAALRGILVEISAIAVL
ncbi:MAG: Rid family hydrolase [Gemmatimonadota bacterium]|nr:Rid family hydrolase [Gemmatimonadota bacterium]MDQ8173009.1 Rid family hydrolase [Gemmatimonadota bacterium]